MAPKTKAQDGNKITKTYGVLTPEELLADEVKHKFSLSVIAVTVNILQEAVTSMEEYKFKVNETMAWQRYLKCDGLPSSDRPEDIRTFLSKLVHYENVDIEKTTNWMLDIDERSVLQQLLTRQDLTKKYLCKTRRRNFGIQYGQDIANYLQIIADIDELFDNPEKYSTISNRILSDIRELRTTTEEYIRTALDQLVARIIASEEGYMEPIDVLSAEYIYSTKNFSTHIWTLQNVPIRFKKNNILSWDVILHHLKVKIVLPFSVLVDNLTLRGNHFRFDHFSNKVRCCLPPNGGRTRPEDEQNLYTSLESEWNWGCQLQTEVQKMMANEYANYVEKMKAKAAEEAKGKKKNDGDGKKKSKKGVLKEPQKLEPGELPDITDDVIQEDLNRYKEYLETELDPDIFHLKPDEVNLRKYQILGGTYQFDLVTKPKNVNFPSVTITWVENDAKLKRESMSTGRDSVASNASMDMGKFFIITFELSETLCHWSEPVACAFDPGNEYYKNVNEKEQHKTTHDNIDAYTPLLINDFNITGILTKPQIYNIVRASLPRLLSSFRFPSEKYEIDAEEIVTLGLKKRVQTSAEKALERTRNLFSFVDQNDPERVYPLFDRFKQIIITDDIQNVDEQSVEAAVAGARLPQAYNKLSDVVQAIVDIKENYLKYPFENIDVTKDINDIKSRLTLSSLARSSKNSQHPKSRASSKSFMSQHGKTKGLKNQKIDDDVVEEGEEIEGCVAQAHPCLIFYCRLLQHVADPFCEASVRVKLIEIYLKVLPPKWTVETIYKTEFDQKNHTMKIWTDRLGIFGFAFYRYRHLPYCKWSLRPSRDDPENETMFTMRSEYAQFEIFITKLGYTATIRTLSKDVQLKSISTDKPITDIQELKKFFNQKNCNIFPECDAACYVEGIFCEKHFPTESHVYSCMSAHCKTMQFAMNVWNRVAPRRIITIDLGEIRDKPENFSTIRLAPTTAQFVTIKELCSQDLYAVDLEYTPTWRNIEFYVDLNQLICSSFSGTAELRVRDPQLLYYLTTLLCAIKPLSFS